MTSSNSSGFASFAAGFFPARWGRPLIVVSVICTVLCLALGIGAGLLPEIPGITTGITAFAQALLLSLIPLCALFVVRGYAITPDAVLIRRAFWWTRLPRKELTSAEVVPNAMRRALRVCGNGGFYSVTGFFWSRSLGHFRPYVTDLSRTVVLRFGCRTVVLSPEDPEEFVRALRENV